VTFKKYRIVIMIFPVCVGRYICLAHSLTVYSSFSRLKSHPQYKRCNANGRQHCTTQFLR